jgi:hypothetical protein
MKIKGWIECNVKMIIVKELSFALCNNYFVKLKNFFQ